jgi:hypothetical protein
LERKIFSRLVLSILLLTMMTSSLNIQHVKAETIIVSGWLEYPVIFDGKISTAEEWSDTSPVELVFTEMGGSGTVNARVWMKNDDSWLYMLYRVEWPAVDTDPLDLVWIDYFWDWVETPYPHWEHSDAGSIRYDNYTFDRYGWDETNWYEDTEAIPPGENNVEGAATHDGGYYWFEFKKLLDSGDGYDFAFSPGQFIDTDVLLLGWGDHSEDIPYVTQTWLQLADRAHIYFNLNPNPVGVGETVTLKGILLTEHSQPISGETVKLYGRTLTGPWVHITSVTTNTYGIFNWQAKIPVEGTFLFAVYYPGSEMYGSCYNIAALIVQ